LLLLLLAHVCDGDADDDTARSRITGLRQPHHRVLQRWASGCQRRLGQRLEDLWRDTDQWQKGRLRRYLFTISLLLVLDLDWL